jgi:hypothetical protein
VNSAGGDDVALAKSFIITCEGPVQFWIGILCYSRTQSAARSTSRQHASISDVPWHNSWVIIPV